MNNEEINYSDFLEVFKEISNSLSLIEEHNAKIVKAIESIDKQVWNMI